MIVEAFFWVLGLALFAAVVIECFAPEAPLGARVQRIGQRVVLLLALPFIGLAKLAQWLWRQIEWLWACALCVVWVAPSLWLENRRFERDHPQWAKLNGGGRRKRSAPRRRSVRVQSTVMSGRAVFGED